MFLNGVVSTSPNPQLECHCSQDVRNYLLNIFTVTLHIAVRSSICNLRGGHANVTQGPTYQGKYLILQIILKSLKSVLPDFKEINISFLIISIIYGKDYSSSTQYRISSLTQNLLASQQ